MEIFDEILAQRQSINNKIQQTEQKRKNELDSLQSEIAELSQKHDKMVHNTNVMQNLEESQQKMAALIDKKKEVLKQKEAYERKIQTLEKQVKELENKSNRPNISTILDIIRSIAPVTITVNEPNRLAGFISYGTPTSMESFDFNRANSQDIPNQFWKSLIKCAAARYDVDQTRHVSSINDDWSCDNDLAW